MSRVVIDLQAAQHALHGGASASVELQLARAMVRHRGGREIILLLSNCYPATIEPIRALFRDELGQECIRLWHTTPLALGAAGAQDAPQWLVDCAREIKAATIAALRPQLAVVPVADTAAAQRCMPVLLPLLPTVVVTDERSAVPQALEHAVTENACCKLVRLPTAKLAAVPDASGQSLRDDAAEPIASVWSAAEALQRDLPHARAVPDGAPRPRLAYVSPVPPEQSGIADYSASLVPALARWYDIDLVSVQNEVSDPWLASNCRLLTPEAFLAEHAGYDRIVYHFGNSKYHDYMLELLQAVPGVVVLHDFFLGELSQVRDMLEIEPHAWERALYASHGYGAVVDRYRSADEPRILSSYPANVEVLQAAAGVIVHSEYARRLAREFYGERFAASVEVIPLLRPPPPTLQRAAARERLGIGPDEFIVCSVGFVAPAKQHHRILAAWKQAAISSQPESRLVFVGETAGRYGELLERTIRVDRMTRVHMTHRVEAPSYSDWLAAADLAVQLRTQSRGETSAAVLDCMSHGVATIVNANGSMADLPGDTVSRLPDDFSDAQLAAAIDELAQDAGRRRAIGERARALIEREHDVHACAQRYAERIEHWAARPPASLPVVADRIGKLAGPHAGREGLAQLAVDIARSVPVAPSRRQLLVDVSAIARTDLKTGIQRVVRALVWEFIQAPPAGYRVEPVVLSDEGGRWHYRYARDWTCRALAIPQDWTQDEPADYAAGDVLLVADFTSWLLREAHKSGLLAAMRDAGVSVNFTVYDLLPIVMPDMFPAGMRQEHEDWLAAATATADRALCISRAVADEVSRYLADRPPAGRSTPLKVEWFHLGADLDNSMPSRGMPADADAVLAALAARPTFLMVGTVEPRKRHADVLAGFEQLWAGGADVNLVVVGKRGWMADEVCDGMRGHPEAGQRLFWIEGASDEYLQRIYQASRCLIAASQGEGFGLPLIEAAQHGLAIFARDIPVFREVAGEHATYFSGHGEAIASCVQAWLRQSDAGQAPASAGMRWLTWRQSADRVLQCLGLAPPPRNLTPEASQEPVAGA